MGRARTALIASRLFRFDADHQPSDGVLAGVDEAGRGPLAGPVVAAAVILSPLSTKTYHCLRDSKQLSASQRLEMYRVIQAESLSIGVGMADVAEIDDINIYQAGHLAMQRALLALIVKPAHVLVDGYPLKKNPFPQTGIFQGDSKSACIAAASIVAKVTRDMMMTAWDRHYPEYGFSKHKGYGTSHHLEQLRRHGPCPLHRRSFGPVNPKSSIKT